MDKFEEKWRETMLDIQRRELKKKLIKICLILGVLLIIVVLVGCGNVSEDAEHTQSRQVQLVVLDDGTRCAVYKGYKKGGLSCDWK